MIGPGSSSIRSADIDADDFRDFASNAVLAADRLSANGQPSQLKQIRVDSWAYDVADVNSRLKVEGSLALNHMAVVVVLRGAGSAICGFPLRENMALILPKGTRIAANAHPGLSYCATTLPAVAWEEICRIDTDTDFVPPGADIGAFDLGDFGAPVRNAATKMASQLTSTAFDKRVPSEPSDVLTDHVWAIAQACSPDRSVRLDRSLRHRMHQAWKAQDFIHAHLHEEISVLRLCREMRVSRRQLEYAFRTAFEVSPTKFIQLTKLNECRRLLMMARKRGLSVTDIAMEVGVNHLGRFSARYRQLFGETPRATLSGASDT